MTPESAGADCDLAARQGAPLIGIEGAEFARELLGRRRVPALPCSAPKKSLGRGGEGTCTQFASKIPRPVKRPRPQRRPRSRQR